MKNQRLGTDAFLLRLGLAGNKMEGIGRVGKGG